MKKNKYSLEQGEMGLPPDSKTLSIVQENPRNFMESQKNAISKFLKIVYKDLLLNMLFIFIGLLFINQFLLEQTLKMSEKRITVLWDNYKGLRKKEINFLCLMMSSYVFIYSLFSTRYTNTIKFLTNYMAIILLHFFVLPFFFILILILLKKYGSKMIIAFYIAYTIKILVEILAIDPLDTNKMVKFSSTLPAKLKLALEKQNLNDKVYEEKTPKSNMNAAIIGYGKKTRIEIYGDLAKLSKSKLFSIFLHELGHNSHKSLLKKSLAYLTTIFVEFILMIFFFREISPNLSEKNTSKEFNYIATVLIYKMCIRQWLFVVYKMVSQHSEIISDNFSKDNGYGQELARALYSIALESRDYIKPTKFYNILRSGHPSIYQRIENLL